MTSPSVGGMSCLIDAPSVKWHNRLETETSPVGSRMDFYLGRFPAMEGYIREDLGGCRTVADVGRVVENVKQCRHVGARISPESCDIFERLVGRVAAEIETRPVFPDACAMREICDRHFVGEQHTGLTWWSSSVVEMEWLAVETEAELADQMRPRLEALVGEMQKLAPRTMVFYASGSDHHRELLASPEQDAYHLRVSVTCEAEVDSTEIRRLFRAPFLVWRGEPPSADTLMGDILKEAWSTNKEILASSKRRRKEEGDEEEDARRKKK